MEIKVGFTPTKFFSQIWFARGVWSVDSYGWSLCRLDPLIEILSDFGSNQELGK